MSDPWSRAAIGLLWVTGALILASGAFAAILHTIPGLHLWRGVSALAIILAAGSAVLTGRLLFDRGWRL